MRGSRHVAHTGEINLYKILVGKPEGMRPLVTVRSRLEDNIRMDLRKMKW
jgi:hypothetical protein